MRKNYILFTAFIAVILLIISVKITDAPGSTLILADSMSVKENSAQPITYNVITLDSKTTITPEPSPVTTISQFSGYPYTLSIPKIGVRAPVVITGLETDGRMAVPNNLTEVGVFNGSAMPGEKGTAVMGAHVDNGGGTPGIFKRLSELQTGDTINVTTHDNHTLVYKVTSVKIYDKDEKATNDVFYSNDGIHLNLITCHGEWLPSEKTYKERLIVFTELMD